MQKSRHTLSNTAFVLSRPAAPFFEASIPLPTVRLFDVVPVFGRELPRTESRFVLASAHEWCLPSCLHMPILANLPPAASPISCALLLNLQICVPFGESGKAVAANGAMPAPSERQRLSLLLFCIAYHFFSQKMTKSGAVSSARFRPQNWGRFPAPYSNY